jgi:hypothetical protein
LTPNRELPNGNQPKILRRFALNDLDVFTLAFAENRRSFRMVLWQDRLKSGEQRRMRDHWDDRLVGLESVLLGERDLAQQTLEIVIFGYATPQEAEGALRRQMEELIRA